MNDILDELAPVKSMTVRDVPNMTSKWKSAIRAKQKATSKHKKIGSVDERQEMKR